MVASNLTNTLTLFIRFAFIENQYRQMLQRQRYVVGFGYSLVCGDFAHREGFGLFTYLGRRDSYIDL